MKLTIEAYDQEINDLLLQKIKQLFSGKKLSVTVSYEEDAVKEITNPEVLEGIEDLKNGRITSVSDVELEKYMKQIENGEDFIIPKSNKTVEAQ